MAGTLGTVVGVQATEALYPLDVEQYHRMVEHGILTEDDRVELLDGMLVEVMTEGSPHAAVHSRLLKHFILSLAAQPALMVRAGNPITLPPRSEPEPDVAIVDEAAATWQAHPFSAYLLIEVSDSSRRIDRGRKCAIYARASLPEYWVVDLVERLVEVRRDPAGETYATVETHRPPATLAPRSLEVAPVDLAKLFAE